MKNKESINKKYPPESAGRQMCFDVPKIDLQKTIAQAESFLIKEIKDLEMVEYIFVVDASDKLKGVLSIKELFRTPKDTRIKDIINRDVVSVHPYTDQEKVALKALQHNLKTIPVVNKSGKLLGAVLPKTILKIMHTEAIEDALIFAGLTDTIESDVTKISFYESIKSRMPWLIIGLIGGIISAQIVGVFEDSLRTNVLIAMFLPIVIYMADAVASQTQALLIRNITSNHRLVLKKYLFKELKISLIVGIICSIILSGVGAIWKIDELDIYTGLVLGASLFAAIVLSVLISVAVPLVINKAKKDPTLSSGPFTTIITDILSLGTYFFVTSWLLN